jgi:sugar/nucleoside kinase (ribokinase family)
VGTLLVDTIHLPAGDIVESLGGIAYSVAYLVAQAPVGVRIEPICRVGSDLWDEVVAAWGRLPSLDPSLLIRAEQPTARNTLVYAGDAEPADGRGRGERGIGDRRERPAGLLPPLTGDDLVVAGGADLVLVNNITGRDLSLEAMRHLSRTCGSVYLDVHSLTLGFAADGSRFYRRPDAWLSWIGCADVVQCNRAEAATLAGMDAFDHDPVEVEAFLEGQLLEAAARQSGKPRAIILTAGEAGATALWRDGGRVVAARAPAAAVEVVDPTGAGDAFGAGCAVAWLSGARPAEAARQGVLIGAAACTVAGVADPLRLRQAVETLRA